MAEQDAIEEPESLEDIYRVHSGMVYGVALRMSGSPEDAQEVTQDVFMAVHRHLGRFEGRSSLKTWLYRITVNRTLNMIRKKKQRQAELRIEEGVEFEDARQDVAKEIERESHEAKVQELMAQLNPEQRACLLLRAKEGLSYEEIANVLKININTVRTRLKRAREALVSFRRERG